MTAGARCVDGKNVGVSMAVMTSAGYIVRPVQKPEKTMDAADDGAREKRLTGFGMSREKMRQATKHLPEMYGNRGGPAQVGVRAQNEKKASGPRLGALSLLWHWNGV